MKDVSHRESFAFSARVLGALFYFAPDSEQAAPLVQASPLANGFRTGLCRRKRCSRC
jgi:TorA maturation chaperone TorD